jgi:HAD superfamily hydrolase (TIGR01509 family)
VKLWILSNHRSPWLEPRLERFDLDRFFERVLVSDRIGHAKPDAGAFAPLLESRSPLLFLDDRKRNVEAARALGIEAVHLTHDAPWLATVDRFVLSATGRADTPRSG